MDASNLLPICSYRSTYPSFDAGSGILGKDSLINLIAKTGTKINYTPGVIEISPDGSDEELAYPLKRFKALDVEVYDSYANQFEVIIRSLPLHEGFQTVIPMLSQAWADSSSEKESFSPIENAKVSVPVRERVTVPAGVFDCYKVVKSRSSGSAIVYWISADEHAYIVKVDDYFPKELKAIKRIEGNKPVVFDESDLGIKISAPAPWYILRYTKEPEISLTEPNSGAVGILSVSGNTAASMEDLLSKDIEDKKGIYRKYQVRAESKTNTNVSGAPAFSILGDIQARGPFKLVEYEFYFIKSNKLYRLIFLVHASRFSDNLKSAMDIIANSIVIR
jgi:hypothetical protein